MKIYTKNDKDIKWFEYKDGTLEIEFQSGNSGKYKIPLSEFYMFNMSLNRSSFFHKRIKGKEL